MRYRRRGGLLALALGVWLAGCGATSGSVAPMASPANTSPPTSAGEGVRIATDHSAYWPNEAIAASVANGLGQSIYALDTRASCSILGLEWRVNGAWVAAQGAGCPLGRIALVAEIKPGATYRTSITAGYPGLRVASFPPGVYRLALAYSLAKIGPGAPGAAVTIYSASFTIGGVPLPPISTEPTVPIAPAITITGL